MIIPTLLIMIGALLIWAGIRDKSPIGALKEVFAGNPPGKTP